MAMLVSRRNVLRTMGAGAAAGATLPLARAASFEPARTTNRDGYIHLERNENVDGPSSKTVEAIRSALFTANCYPAGCDQLTEQIASFHKVAPEQVLLGCGSSEILRVAAAAFLAERKRMLQASPTFEAIEHYARAAGGEVVSVPLTPTFAHDLDTMLKKADSSVGLLYICNPNNPTATITPRQDLEDFISKLPPTCCVLVDEAYHHYAGQAAYASFIDRPVPTDRLIVTRTFSQVYGLAGFRLGYCVAPRPLIEQMRTQLLFDNVNSLVIRAASAALKDTSSIQEFVRRNADARQEFLNQAVARTLRPIDSHANFIMLNTKHPATAVIDHFRKSNILIGPEVPAMNTYIRVSLGTPEDMRKFWKAWDTLPYPKGHVH